MLVYIIIKIIVSLKELISHCLSHFLSDLTALYHCDISENRLSFHLGPILCSFLEWDSPIQLLLSKAEVILPSKNRHLRLEEKNYQLLVSDD